jgi:hypothetical protein
MTPQIDQVRARVAAQKTALPGLYGEVDFDRVPERFTENPAESVAGGGRAPGVAPTADDLALVRAYTLMGDRTADAYAALMPTHKFGQLIGMLTAACDHGIEAVPNAPPELKAFIADMERIPDWLDMDLVREGARADLNSTANLAPYAIRGAFVATFMNKYSALPMALTGTLGHETAAKRVNETATFFATTVLPDALERHGPGFKAAAMVRLMHSMVRFNALRRAGAWDTGVYGVPIPQVDQMPAGLIPIFLMSYRLMAKGKTTFTRKQRAQVELARYRCFLLGLPEDLLSDTPEGIVRIMNARSLTLRRGFDDETCGTLVRATLAAYLPPDQSLGNRVHNGLERGFAKLFFVRQFLAGDARKAAAMGVKITAGDRAAFAAVALLVVTRVMTYRLALAIPGVKGLAEAALVRRVRRLLTRYGHAEFTSNAEQYRPAVGSMRAAA